MPVDARRTLVDSSSRMRPAALHGDGLQVQVATLPVAFPVPGGVIGRLSLPALALFVIGAVYEAFTLRYLVPHLVQALS
jgi:hypothetical protein